MRTGGEIDTPRLDRALRHGGSRAQGTTLLGLLRILPVCESLAIPEKAQAGFPLSRE
ncbi:MAG: hypothetical protein IPH59_03605 [bacterium]|nr:hypothetical protein [bacterium]